MLLRLQEQRPKAVQKMVFLNKPFSEEADLLADSILMYKLEQGLVLFLLRSEAYQIVVCSAFRICYTHIDPPGHGLSCPYEVA